MYPVLTILLILLVNWNIYTKYQAKTLLDSVVFSKLMYASHEFVAKI